MQQRHLGSQSTNRTRWLCAFRQEKPGEAKKHVKKHVTDLQPQGEILHAAQATFPLKHAAL
jgi:hypothetical protein